jgi:hypothetical protein
MPRADLSAIPGAITPATADKAAARLGDVDEEWLAAALDLTGLPGPLAGVLSRV